MKTSPTTTPLQKLLKKWQRYKAQQRKLMLNCVKHVEHNAVTEQHKVAHYNGMETALDYCIQDISQLMYEEACRVAGARAELLYPKEDQ